MKKILITIFATAMLAIGGSAYSEGINHHGLDMQELVTIHDQMSVLDRQLSQDPNNPSLIHAMEQLELDLVTKLRKFNKMIAQINKKKAEALETMPAAGNASE